MTKPTLSRRLSEWLIDWRWPLFILGLAVAAVALWPARKLDFDRSIENMFAPDDPLIPPYQRLKRTFGGNEIVLAVYVDKDLLAADGSGIRRLEGISARLEHVEGVAGVLSLDRPLGELIASPDSPIARNLRKLFEGYTHGSDGQTVAVACMLKPEKSVDVDRQKTIADLRAIMKGLPDGLAPGMLAGEPVMVADGFRELEKDGKRLGVASTILLALTIVICFRSLRWVLIPIVIVQLTLVLTRALLVGVGLRLSMVSSMLTAIVTVVGVGTVVHIIVGYREARRTGLSSRAALLETGAILALPVMWSILTDVVGFGSLIFAGVGPVQDFGTMSAAGSFVVLVCTALVLPVLALTGRFDADPKQAWGEASLDLGLGRLIHWVERRPKTVGVLALLFSVLAAAGAARLDVETDFTRNFRAGSSIVKSYEFVEANLGGAGVWDVVLPAPATLDWNYLKKVERLEERLRVEVVRKRQDGTTEPGLTKVLSLADAVRASAITDLDSISIEFVRQTMISGAVTTMRTKMPTFIEALHAEDPDQPGQYRFRIMLRAYERQTSAEKHALIDQVSRISREEFPEAETTGFFVLLTNIIESISRDQWTTFGAAAAGIFVMMIVAFRSPVLALVALVPNALPIFMVMGLMGWLGLKINMGAAMIAAVSMGLSVDSSIHYITSFRRSRAAGLSVGAALAAVQQTVGRAMVFSTLALIIGFSVLCISEFVPTIYFGCLVSLAMLGGLFGNLLVLPLLLKLVTRN